MFGLLYTLEKYKKSIPAINVIGTDGGEYCGSGLLVKISSNKLGILTNAHVLENNTIKNIAAGEVEYSIIGEPILAKNIDLALIPVEIPKTYIPNFVLSKSEILQTVIAIGYPRISNTVDQYALFHKGEINGRVKTMDGNVFLAISCHVSPGNSGGPLISEIGELVGVVTQSNTGKYLTDDPNKIGYESTYHMAIPANVINEFLDGVELS